MNDERDLISVIVPVYNAERYLCESLESLLAQTYKDIEVILVDDGSKDSSYSICQEFAEHDKRVKAFHKENGGVASARNFGIDRAQGKYIGFMDNDDYLEPKMFEVLLEELKKTDAYISQILIEDVDEKHLACKSVEYQSEYIKEIPSHEFKKQLLLQTANMVCWSKLFKREVFDSYRFVDGRWNEDVLILYKIFSDSRYSKLISINTVGYHYVQRKGSYSKSGFNKGYIDNLVNARWFIEQEKDPELSECAYRLYFHQFVPYFLFSNADYINENKQEYTNFVSLVKTEKSHWTRNKYLSKKEKVFLSMVSVAPKLTKRIVGGAYQRRK